MMTDSIYQYTPVFDVFKVHALKNVYVHTQCESNDEKEGGDETDAWIPDAYSCCLLRIRVHRRVCTNSESTIAAELLNNAG
jgi:hypothetical protein